MAFTFCLQIEFGGAGALAVLSLAFTAGVGFRRQGWGDDDNPVPQYCNTAWGFLQPLLFALIGTEIQVGGRALTGTKIKVGRRALTGTESQVGRRALIGTEIQVGGACSYWHGDTGGRGALLLARRYR